MPFISENKSKMSFILVLLLSNTPLLRCYLIKNNVTKHWQLLSYFLLFQCRSCDYLIDSYPNGDLCASVVDDPSDRNLSCVNQNLLPWRLIVTKGYPICSVHVSITSFTLTVLPLFCQMKWYIYQILLIKKIILNISKFTWIFLIFNIISILHSTDCFIIIFFFYH